MFEMSGLLHKILRCVLPLAPVVTGMALCIMPNAAHANIVDALNLAPFIPMVLDALMTVATGGYDFFVGHGTGIIYLLVWGFVAVSVALYLVKMYFPKMWVSFFGFSGGGELVDGNIDGMKMSMNLLKPMVRAVVAAVFLLQVRPVFVTQWLVNPFLEFGAVYTSGILDTINQAGAPKITCPQNIIEKGWISQRSCEFLVQPVSEISHANNQIIKRGFDFIERGLLGLMGLLIPHGAADIMNLVTGVLLVSTFVSCNLFMALLIIQAIFDFGMALVLYPFNVLMWVAKPKNPDKWIDLWPPFSGIIDALKKIVITMIACAFILCVNIAVIRALFHWNNSVFMVGAGGVSTSNVPSVAGPMGFGSHSVLWLSTILTFYLMLRIFELTREQLRSYTKGVSDGLYKQVMSDSKTAWDKGVKVYQKAPDAAKAVGKGAVATYDGAKWLGGKTWNGMKWVGGKVGGWFR